MEMFYYIHTIANENPFLGFSKIGFRSFFIEDVVKYKITKNAKMCKVLFLVYPNFFKNQFSVTLALYK